MSLFNKFKLELGKSSSGLSIVFSTTFSKNKLNTEVLSEYATLLIISATGIDVAKQLRQAFESFRINKRLDTHKEILKLI